MAATGTVAMVPSGNVTVTDDPGSAAPETVSVPFGLAAVATVGTAGGVLSVNVLVTAGDTLPAESLSTTDTRPEDWGAAEVTE